MHTSSSSIQLLWQIHRDLQRKGKAININLTLQRFGAGGVGISLGAEIAEGSQRMHGPSDDIFVYRSGDKCRFPAGQGQPSSPGESEKQLRCSSESRGQLLCPGGLGGTALMSVPASAGKLHSCNVPPEEGKAVRSRRFREKM